MQSVDFMSFDLNLVLEVLGVIFNLLFLILIIKEKIAGWIFGILGSLVSIFLFYRIQLYSESILYIYYVIIGFYGYYLWSTKGKDKTSLTITTWDSKKHILIISTGIIAGVMLGYVFEEYTEAKNAYLDAFTTIFSFIASYLEAKKIFSTWVFWIIINGVTIWLYTTRGLDIYTLLTVVYFIASFIGYFNWKKKMETSIQ